MSHTENDDYNEKIQHAIELDYAHRYALHVSIDVHSYVLVGIAD